MAHSSAWEKAAVRLEGLAYNYCILSVRLTGIREHKRHHSGTVRRVTCNATTSLPLICIQLYSDIMRTRCDISQRIALYTGTLIHFSSSLTLVYSRKCISRGPRLCCSPFCFFPSILGLCHLDSKPTTMDTT
jgi:hypothetical protein